MSKRNKILLAIVAAVLVIGLATGAFTFGDIVSSLLGERAPQAVMQEDAGVTAPIEDENSDELILIEESEPEQPQEESQSQEQLPVIDENGAYYSKDDVALYIHTVEDYAPGCSIGGDRFGNYEGILPEGKKYTECDIDTLGRSSRGAKRIVFSNDGCIYYTDDHYETFELLYGEE